MNHLFSILLLGLAAPLSLAASRPVWAEAQSASRDVTIVAIEAGAAQDLVVLDGGLEQGLRRGMITVAADHAGQKARLLIAEAAADRSVALILALESGRILQPGDTVRRSLIRL